MTLNFATEKLFFKKTVAYPKFELHFPFNIG